MYGALLLYRSLKIIALVQAFILQRETNFRCREGK